MWGKLATFIATHAATVLKWAKAAWSAVAYTRFAKAVSQGSAAIVAYCTKFPNDCIHLIKVFL
ncbi:hypothetical protein [Priestia aryabhattai]|uniref:hypothetical protein n=1 Tax=Priestia aryabhattai TaxID=412384 RepID=UPI001CF98A98|nr:hypothetical protein [Priestia aryabhattai]